MKRPEASQPPRAFFIFRRFRYVLKIKLQTELDDAHSTVCGNLAEGGAAAVIIRIEELNMVEGVKEFGAELKRRGFAYVSVLNQRKIELLMPGPRNTLRGIVPNVKSGTPCWVK